MSLPARLDLSLRFFYSSLGPTSSKTVERRRVLAREIDRVLRHAVAQGFHVALRIFDASLKVAVAAKAGKLVLRPLCTQNALRRAGSWVIMRQP